MIEYTDGNFGVIAPAKDIMEHLYKKHYNKCLDDIKAVHFGTASELDLIRNNKVNMDSLQERLSELERQVETLKPSGKVKVYSIEDIPKVMI